jgi:hypothetical protein
MKQSVTVNVADASGGSQEPRGMTNCEHALVPHL